MKRYTETAKQSLLRSSISHYKETGESIYWLTLLSRTKLLDYDYPSLLVLAEEIKRMLIASLNTAKNRST